MPELRFPTVASYLCRLAEYGLPIRARRIEPAVDFSGELIRAFNDGFEYLCATMSAAERSTYELPAEDVSELRPGELRRISSSSKGDFVIASAKDSLYTLLVDEIGLKNVNGLRNYLTSPHKLILVERRRVVSLTTNMEYSFVLPARSLVEKFRC